MEKVVIILNFINKGIRKDIEVPLNLTANELILALNRTYLLGINTENMMELYLRVENPITLLKGNKTLEEFKIRDGSIINILD